MYKKLIACLLGIVLLAAPLQVLAEENLEELKLDEDLPEAVSVISIADSLPAKSAVLMEQTTGQVLYEQNADEQLPPASVTKVMTLLLVMEALDSGKITLEDKVTTSETAASMGGSQIWLKVGEQMTVNELLKAVAISSANDASVALGEHLAGSHEAFVEQMNRRAKELGMENTNFVNCTGLDAEGHLTTARDIAIMSQELMKHPQISDYSTVWMDSLRGGETELVNTNRLVRFYNGATGLKTGTTSGAGSCLSATATRDGLSLVAVVMGCPTSDERFASARGLLDFGFANYMAVEPPAIDDQLTPVRVLGGMQDTVVAVGDRPGFLILEKQNEDAITQEITLSEDLQAPVEAGQVIGKVEVLVDGRIICDYPLRAAGAVEKMTVPKAFGVLLRSLFTMSKNPAVPLSDQELVVRLPQHGAEAGGEAAVEEETVETVAIATFEEYDDEDLEETMALYDNGELDQTMALEEEDAEETMSFYSDEDDSVQVVAEAEEG